jgi:hypothetical protein
MTVDGTYEHYIYADDPAALHSVASELQQHGLLGTVGDGYVVAYGSLARHFDDTDDDLITAVCDRYGAQYDGGGVYVGPLPPLRPDDAG